MKQRIKRPEPEAMAFWAVEKDSKSGVAHLVTDEPREILGWKATDNPWFYLSPCGRRYAFYELQSVGFTNVSAKKCKRCVAAKEKDNG